MRWGPQTWILAPAPMPFRVRPQASSPPLCTSAAYSVNHQNSNPLRRRQAFATPLLPQPSRRAHGTVPAPTPARPRDLETERKRPMPPRSTQSVLGSTPPPNLSDSAAKPGNVSAHLQWGTEGSAPTRDGHRNGGRRAAKLQQRARPARQRADRTPRCGPELGYRPACERRVCANVAAGRTPTPVSGVWVPAGLPPYHTHLGKCL